MRFFVRDDLRRSRLTTGFRLILAIPHLIWFSLWASIMLLLLPIQWFAVLFTRKPIEGLAEVYEMLTRYSLHVYSYLYLAGSPFPGFLGKPGSYPIDVDRIPAEEQNRWSAAFRLFLALPPFVLVSALGSGLITSSSASGFVGAGAAIVAAFLAWFAILAKGRMPPGLRDLTVYAGAYATQVAAYFFLITGRYPDSDPRRVPLLPRPRHPVRMQREEDLDRPRLVVFFRLILALPHIIWLLLWAIVAFLAVFIGWLAAIFMGRLPTPLHRFLAAYVRYNAHVSAFVTLAARPFPGFVGQAGSYPALDIEIAPPEKQSRWTIGFRWLLAVPAFMVSSGLSTVQSVAPVGAWFYALVTGRAPRGLAALLAYTVRYQAQVLAYSYLLTPTYPHSGPSEEEGDPEAVLLQAQAQELGAAPQPAFDLAPERPPAYR